MKYFLSDKASLKLLENPCVYHIKNDELYELDFESFDFLKRCSESGCSAKKNDFIDYCLKEGILVTKKIDSRRPPLEKSPVPSLRYIELQITNKCNLRCKHCYIADRGTDELSLKSIRDILKEFEYMQGLRVLITGGEPLLHNRFEEINEMLSQFLIRKVLFTNGTLLSEKKLKHLNFNEFQISIDGLEKSHDSLRGIGTFKKAMNAVKLSLDYGFNVSIATMVHPENINDFDRMKKLFMKIGIKEWQVDIPCITGRLTENVDFQMNPKEGGKYLRYGYGTGIHTSSSGFACGLHLMAIIANGNVAKCTFYSDAPVGKVEEGLRKCWERIKPVTIDELKCDCEYIESCRGGCRYRAQLSGDPLGKDLYRCALYGTI